jgi:hypothetical protein
MAVLSASATAVQAQAHPKHPPPVTLASLQKLMIAENKATQAQLASLFSQLTNLRSQVSAVESKATNGDAQLAAITPIVQSITQRLYDTCALTSDLWSRSFPDFTGQNGQAWTQTGAAQTSSSVLQEEDILRCYSAAASANGGGIHGILPSNARVDDTYTATPP